jgi:cytoskeletal protein RodZ
LFTTDKREISIMKFKHLALLALTTCTLIVIGAGIAKGFFIPESSPRSFAPTSVLAQSIPDGQAVSEAAAVNQATLEYLRQGRENLPQSPAIRRTVIKEGYALATWTWGEAGGQTVLSLANEKWTVLTGGGGAVDVSVLEAAGVPTTIAEQLIESDQAGW